MFLLHKKKKSFIWDIDSLMHWNHVSTVVIPISQFKINKEVHDETL